jgi:cyclopropane fatty-acyl-phospholipid synthase-like methyltransferase
VRFWRYSAADYYASISGVTISPERLKKLDKLDTAELAAVSAQISKKGYAGYQEALVDALAADIHQGTVLDLN